MSIGRMAMKFSTHIHVPLRMNLTLVIPSLFLSHHHTLTILILIPSILSCIFCLVLKANVDRLN